MEQPLIHNVDTVHIGTSHALMDEEVDVQRVLWTFWNLRKFQPADFKALTHIFSIPLKCWIANCFRFGNTSASIQYARIPCMFQHPAVSHPAECNSSCSAVQACLDDDDRPRPLSPILLGIMLLTLPNLVKFQHSDYKWLMRIFNIWFWGFCQIWQ